jgi:midasin (ATPase involved in ribosome maturation)
MILSSQIETLKNLTECVLLEKPVILCGPSDCGKTKVIDTFCSIFNKNLYNDTIDDSVTGSFQQFDFNRMLEDLSQEVEKILLKKLAAIAVSTASSKDKCNMVNLFKLWQAYDGEIEILEESSANSELESFCKRVDAVMAIIEALIAICKGQEKENVRQMMQNVASWQKILQSSSNVLNTGGRF